MPAASYTSCITDTSSTAMGPGFAGAANFVKATYPSGSTTFPNSFPDVLA